MKIILVNGKKRSGKDYFAYHLRKYLESHDKKACIMSFANPLKEIVADTFDITFNELDTYKNNTSRYVIDIRDGDKIIKQTDFRKILQYCGNEGLKSQFGSNVWVNLFNDHVKQVKTDFVIVPDFRFLIEDMGDYTIHIFDDDNEIKDTHISENELNDFKFDYYVDNTGHQDLSKEVQRIASDIMKKN